MVNIIVPDKRPNAADHTLQRERAQGDVWAAASQRGAARGCFTPDIHLAPESHFITGSLIDWTPDTTTLHLQPDPPLGFIPAAGFTSCGKIRMKN